MILQNDDLCIIELVEEGKEAADKLTEMVIEAIEVLYQAGILIENPSETDEKHGETLSKQFRENNLGDGPPLQPPMRATEAKRSEVEERKVKVEVEEKKTKEDEGGGAEEKRRRKEETIPSDGATRVSLEESEDEGERPGVQEVAYSDNDDKNEEGKTNRKREEGERRDKEE